MTDRLTPTEIHEQLDRLGLLDDAQKPGVYALEAAVPDSVETVHRMWLDHSDAVPPDGTLTRLAAADDVCYAGASKSVYDRLADHARGDVRTAAFLEVFDPVSVVGVWPAADPTETAERERARTLAREGWTCWTDGVVVG